MSIEDKASLINSWLRYHTDYQVQIFFFSLYGCLECKITHGPDMVLHTIGDTLEHRLDECIAFLMLQGWKP